MISFNYKILNVDLEKELMEVEYTAEGFEPTIAGMPIPKEGESILNYIRSYSPIPLLIRKEKPLITVNVGEEGTIHEPSFENPSPSFEELKIKKKLQVANWRYFKESSGIHYQKIKISTDRESQAKLTAAHIAVQNQIVQSIDWKTATGDFVTLYASDISEIVRLVINHVQYWFSAEKDLNDQINLCTNVDELNAVVIPE